MTRPVRSQAALRSAGVYVDAISAFLFASVVVSRYHLPPSAAKIVPTLRDCDLPATLAVCNNCQLPGQYSIGHSFPAVPKRRHFDLSKQPVQGKTTCEARVAS